MTVEDTLAQVQLAGQLVTGHGFAGDGRTYEVVIEMTGPSPEGEGEAALATTTLLFTRCVEVHYAVHPSTILEDLVCATAKGELRLAPNDRWSDALGMPMHYAELTTTAYDLALVFGGVEVSSIPRQADWVGGAQS
ncbi:MAG: hypothetical protein U0556_13060 [Dehalococcoidia bacterium]